MLSTGITPILGIVTAAVSTSETSKKKKRHTTNLKSYIF